MEYHQALRQAIEAADNSPIVLGRSEDAIRADIEAVTTQLRGPLSNVDRICLCAERLTLRRELSAVEAATAKA